MSLRLQEAFERRALQYWREHPQEWQETCRGQDLWDGAYWTLAAFKLKDGSGFWSWFDHADLDTHLRDQMWQLIKDTDPTLYHQHYDSPPVERHRGCAQRQRQDGAGRETVEREEGL